LENEESFGSLSFTLSNRNLGEVFAVWVNREDSFEKTNENFLRQIFRKIFDHKNFFSFKEKTTQINFLQRRNFLEFHSIGESIDEEIE